MNISEYSVRRPITMIMATLLVIVLGWISLNRLPLAFMPEMSSTRLSIYVPYSSSSPEEVERLITQPIEDLVSTVSNLDNVTSTSSANGSQVSVQFKDGTDMDVAAMEIRDRVDRAWQYLPDDVELIRIRRWQSTDMPIFNFSLSWNRSKTELVEFVNNVIEPRIERIEGVANVDVSGVEKKVIMVELNQALLRAHHIDVYQLIQSLRANNMNLSGGYIFDGGRKFTIRTIGEFKSVSEIARVPIRGTNIYLKDVANVRYDYPTKTRYRHLNGRDAVILSVYKASNANVVDVAKRIKNLLSEFEHNTQYAGLNIQVFRDQSEEILSSIHSLKWSGIFGAILAILVLFAFLRKWRSTLIISLAIPISLLFTFLVMYMTRLSPFKSGITLNLLSMMAMIYAIGMVVDPSIVVLENIFRHKQEEGLAAREAAIEGSREVGTAVFAATLTTMIVFLPRVVMSSGGMGRFMFEFGLVICVILFSSLVIAITVVPLLASFLFTGKEKPKSKEVVWLTNGYRKIMEWTLQRPAVTIGAALLVLGVSLFLYTKIDREFMPPAPTRRIDFRVDIPPSYQMAEIKELFTGIEKTFLTHKKAYDIKAISTDFGKGRSSKGGRGRLTFFLTDEKNSHLGTMEALQKIQAALPRLPGVAFRVRRMHGMSGGEMGVSVVLKGDNLDVLTLIADEVRKQLEPIPGVKDVETSLESGNEEIQVAVNRNRVNQYGLSTRRVAQTIFSALTSRASSKFKTKDREVDIQIQLREADRANLQKLRNLTVGSEKKTLVPLYTMVQFKKARGPQQLVRERRRHVVTVYANLQKRGMYSATQAISGVLSRVELPPGYTWEFGRNYRRWRQSESQSWFVLALSVVLILMVMASLFESILQPFVIMFSVPFAIIGILFFFWLTNTNLSQVGMLGVIIVFGLVVNNGIILIDHINHLRQSGLSRRNAILKGGQNRLRPILMTAATTDLGLLPLILPIFFPSVFGPTEGRAGMWAPVGLAIFGGLTVSTFLTLIVLPAIYQVVDDFGIWLRSLGRKL